MTDLLPSVTADALAMAGATAPIREAIYMHDTGQPCVCSEQGDCYMHAQQKRAVFALDAMCGAVLDALAHLERSACQDVTLPVQRTLRGIITPKQDA